MKYTNNKGFTLIELLVVIAVIGLLSSIVLVSLKGVRAKTRDARRIHDLNQIKTALFLYYDTYDNWIGAGSGCGYDGGGMGWFNYVGGLYPASIVQCLINAGFLAKEIIDPTGGRTSSPINRYAYMKYHCGTRVYMYAKLETKAQDSTATDGTCCPSCDSDYGMNYYLQIQ